MEESPFEINRKLLYWAFLWRPRGDFLVYWILYCVFFVVMVGHVGSEAVGIYDFRDDLQLLATIICISLTGCNAFLKITYFMYKGHQDLMMQLESIMQKYTHQTEEESIAIRTAGIKRSKQITLRYLWLWLLTAGTWMAVPLIFGDPTSPYERPIPFLASFPFNISITPYYEIALGFQLASSFEAAYIVGVTDAVCISLFIQVAAQLKVINGSFRSMVTRARRSSLSQDQRELASSPVGKGRGANGEIEIIEHSFEEVEYDPDKTNALDLVSDAVNDRSCKLMIECVQHHQEIISYIQEMESLLSPLMFYQCVSSIFIICFVTFLAASSSLEIASLLKCTVYLTVTSFQIWMYCTYGDDIMSEALQIGDAAFSCDWIVSSTKLKRNLMMIIAMERRPLRVRAAQFYVLSLQTFASLLNASYTYFTLLQRVHGNE